MENSKILPGIIVDFENLELKLKPEHEEFLKLNNLLKSPDCEIFYVDKYFQKLKNGNFKMLTFEELPEIFQNKLKLNDSRD